MDNPLSKLLNLYKSRNFVRAEKEYLNIIKKVKPNHELLNLYGVILFQLKKYDQAIVQLKKSIEINPNYYQGYNSLGNIDKLVQLIFQNKSFRGYFFFAKLIKSSKFFENSSSLIFSSFILILSLTLCKCGEVKQPIFFPVCIRVLLRL